MAKRSKDPFKWHLTNKSSFSAKCINFIVKLKYHSLLMKKIFLVGGAKMGGRGGSKF